MFKSGADTEFSGDFFLVLLFAFVGTLRSELLHGEDGPAVLGASLDKTDGSSGATAKDPAPFTILFREMGLGSVL